MERVIKIVYEKIYNYELNKCFVKLFKQIKTLLKINSKISLTLLIEIEPFQVNLIKKILNQDFKNLKIKI